MNALGIVSILERTINNSREKPMDSQKQAYYGFATETDYLCEAVNADLKPHPPPCQDFPCYFLKITLAVRACVLDMARSTTTVGEQAVTWAPVMENLEIFGSSARSVREMGVRLISGNRIELTPGRVVACRFGEPDPEFGYQRIISCRVVDPAQYHLMPVPRSSRRKPSGIDWDDASRQVWLTAKPDEKEGFGGHAIPFRLFTHIAEHGKRYCTYNALIDLIMEAKRADDPVDRATILKHAQTIRRKIGPLNLSTECLPGQGYRIVKTTDDEAIDLEKKRRLPGG
jgi:hypothetical protein